MLSLTNLMSITYKMTCNAKLDVFDDLLEGYVKLEKQARGILIGLSNINSEERCTVKNPQNKVKILWNYLHVIILGYVSIIVM